MTFPLSVSLSLRRAKVLECSAKEDTSVTELFKTLLSLSRFLPASGSGTGPGGGAGGAEAAPSGFKRRSSAYVSASSSRSKYKSNNNNTM